MMRKFTGFAALLCAVAAPATMLAQAPAQPATSQAAPSITLSEARRLGANASPSLVAAREQVGTALWERRAAFSDLVTPNVSAGAGYTRFSDPFFNFGTGTVSPNATSATLNASYTVLGGGKLGAVRRSRASVDRAEANETATRFRAAMQTDAAFFAVLADRELSRVAADGLRRAAEQFAIARVRVLAGEAISTDSLQLLLEVTRARLTVLQADSALAVSRLRLGRETGVEGPVDAVAPPDSVFAPELPLTEAEAVAQMRARGPEVEAARAAERWANASVLAERESYLPEISVAAVMGAYDAEFFPSAFRRNQLAVVLTVPIWDAGQRELAMARARAGRNTAAAERRDRERGAAEVMTSAYRGYVTARAGIELARVGLAAAGESFRVQRARYAAGATTILDLLESQVALTQAEAALVQARYSARLALAQMEYLLGRRIIGDEK
jgi:outer membrane protein TolC